MTIWSFRPFSSQPQTTEKVSGPKKNWNKINWNYWQMKTKAQNVQCEQSVPVCVYECDQQKTVADDMLKKKCVAAIFIHLHVLFSSITGWLNMGFLFLFRPASSHYCFIHSPYFHIISYHLRFWSHKLITLVKPVHIFYGIFLFSGFFFSLSLYVNENMRKSIMLFKNNINAFVQNDHLNWPFLKNVCCLFDLDHLLDLRHPNFKFYSKLTSEIHSNL